VHRAPVDMRQSFDTLSALVRSGFGAEVLGGDVFVFVGRRRRNAKVLYWDGTGLVVLRDRAAPRPCGDPKAPCTRDWVKDLGTFVASDHIKDSLMNPDPNSPGVRQLRREDFMERLRTAAGSGDRGAQHVLRQIEGR
jgi:hypothetical protein